MPEKLLELDSGANAFELGLESLGVFLGDAFLDLGGNAFDKGLRLGQILEQKGGSLESPAAEAAAE